MSGLTTRARVLGGTILAVIVVGGLSYGQYQNTKQIAKLSDQPPVVVTKTVVVTPTVIPTATPSATFKARISTPTSATKGVTR